MLEKIIEKPLWDYLKTTSKPIILYGMGNGADMIIDVLESMNICFSDTFASDEFVRGHYFHGKKVLTLSEVKDKYDDFIILMTFAVHSSDMLDKVKQLANEYEFYSPTVPIASKELFTIDYIRENEELFDKAYSLLSDDKSKQDFVDILNFKISGKVKYLFRCHYQKRLLYNEILHLNDDEVIVDLGAYDGDTIREFLDVTSGKYRKIIAFEPDSKNFAKLQRKTSELSKIELHNIGAWDKKDSMFFAKKGGRNSRLDTRGVEILFNSVDNVINDYVSFIKMDIEGAELKALAGATQTIRKYKPKLYICAYHRNEDFFALPLKIHELYPKYRIYLRAHPYIPAWETNFYAIAD